MPSWKCQNCGYSIETEKPPETCPNCKAQCEFVNNTCYTPDCKKDGIDKRIR